MMIIGATGFVWLDADTRQIGTVVLETNSLIFFAFAFLIGFQTVLFAMYAKVYGVTHGLLPKDEKFLGLFDHFRLETALVIGFVLLLAGTVGFLWFFFSWTSQGAGDLNTAASVRTVLPFLISVYLGITVIFSGFFLSMLGLENNYWTEKK